MDKRVRSCTTLLGDTELLGRLNAGDMVALEAKYHTQCLVGLYNHARKVRLEGIQDSYKEQATSASQTAFAELVLYTDEMRLDEEPAPVFKLDELTKLYHSGIEQLGIKLDTRVLSARLRERLLVEFLDMRAYSKGKNVLIAVEDDVGTSIVKACELDSDKDAIHLARTAQIVRHHMFKEAKPFNGFPERCQEESVPKLLLALVSMVLEGTSIKDQVVEETTPAALAQMLKFNSIKHKPTQHAQGPTVSVRNSVAQETPVPMCIGLMLHTHTRKKKLIDKMAHMHGLEYLQ